MAGARGERLTASRAIVLRTPLLPLAEFSRWADGGADLAALRAHLRALVEQPAIRDALFVASPDLDDSLPLWLEQPDSPRGQKVERTLVRYLSRMAVRPTPFGLFSGVSAGTLGDVTRLELAARAAYQRHTRLDNDYLFALCEALVQEPAIRAALRWRPNSSLYRSAGRLRYAQARVADRERMYHLVAVQPTEYLERTLARAAAGATRDEPAQGLCADDDEVEREEADAFVDELISSQLLVSDLTPAVTGREPIHGLLATLRGANAAPAAADVLAGAQQAIERLDVTGPGAAPDVYRDIATGLGALPAKVELSRLFQIDMVKPTAAATIGPDAIDAIARAIETLRQIAPPAEQGPLERFRAAFTNRYEGREGVDGAIRGGIAAAGRPRVPLRRSAGAPVPRA